MNDQDLVKIIEQKLAFQTKWRRIMSGCYLTTTALSIICSGSGSILAAFGYRFWAAVSAGSATILIGLEKVFLFREKWTHHLNCAANLESLEVSVKTGSMTTGEVSKELSRILIGYARDLPVELRPKLQERGHN
jgi:hypothetical protein